VISEESNYNYKEIEMLNKDFYSWTGIALIGAGIATAAFWLLALPFESFAGPEVPLHSLFVPGQVFHLLGAILAVFGYFGLYLKQKDQAGTLGTIGFWTASIGMMFFLADAMIGLVIFPTIAEHAPELTDPTGPLFTGRVLGFYIMFAVTNMVGIILFGIATLRAKVFPKIAALLFLLGGIMFNLPPMPALHYILVAGGILWGGGAVWLGNALHAGKE
jgi:hypothetical protein